MDLKFASIVLVFGLLGALLVPVAKADGLDDLHMIVTVNNAVEIPGRVLAPGTYMWRFTDLEHQHLQVLALDGNNVKPVGIFRMLPVSRADVPNDVQFDFAKTDAGSPQRISGFFYPGLTKGYEFQYAGSTAAFTAEKSKTRP
jgi:hypothetical protein